MSSTQSLYTKIIDISEDYLGPAAARFISRMATNHLGKPATRITSGDIPELITWVQLAANVMTEDTEDIERYVERLRQLAAPAKPRKRKLSASQVDKPAGQSVYVAPFS